MQAHLVRAAEVKRAIEWVMCNLDGHYAADSVAAAIALGAMVAESSQESNGQGGALPPSASLRSTSKVFSSPGKGSDAICPSNLSKNFRFSSLLTFLICIVLTLFVVEYIVSVNGRYSKLF